MKLRTKVLLTLIPMTILFILIFNAVGVSMLNDQATIMTVRRPRAPLNESGSASATWNISLNIKCGDYSYWDDTWEYFVELNDTYTENNLNAVTLYSYEVDAVLLYDNTSTLVYSISSMHPIQRTLRRPKWPRACSTR